MSDFTEYAFITPAGFVRYEHVHRERAMATIEAFKRMHGATRAWPARREGIRYARREMTTDALILAHDPKAAARKRDVVIYADLGCTEPVARFPWHQWRPNRRQRRITLNCAGYPLIWLSDLEQAA
jgi:hypothetical protein